jgi:predicted nucleotidyltransferase
MSDPITNTTLSPDGLVVATLRAAIPNLFAIYAFGSRVTGTAQAQSDLDLAVLVAGYVEPLVLWDLSAQLADRLGCEVDLLDLRAASTVMQYQVVQTGRRLWGDALQAGLFECYVLNEKLALDEARAPLLRDIEYRGTVYGR